MKRTSRLSLTEWEELRLIVTIHELRLRASLRVPQIAKLLKLKPADVTRRLRPPRPFRGWRHTWMRIGETLTVSAKAVDPNAQEMNANLEAGWDYADPVMHLTAWRHGSAEPMIRSLLRKNTSARRGL